jgi:choline kinase
MPAIEGAVIAAAGGLQARVRRVHVVVGYREEIVLDYCAQHHRDIILVRNPQYRSTTTSQSYALGARHLSGNVVFMDGDLLIEDASIEKFLAEAAETPVLIGVTKAKTEHAVYAKIIKDGKKVAIIGFDYGRAEDYEWANVVSAPCDFFNRSEEHVFQTLAKHLPLPAHELDVFEVDTQRDLQAARARYGE